MSKNIWCIIELINVILELIIVYVFHSKLYERKYDNKIYYAAFYLIGAAILYISGLFTNNSSILITITFFMIYMIAHFLYNSSNVKKIFCSAMFIVFVIISEMLFISMMSAMKLGSPADIVKQGINRLIGMAGTKIIYFWIIYIICNLINKRTNNIPLKYWIMIILMPCLSTVILCVLFQSMLISGEIKNYIYFLSVSGLLYINLAVFDFFETYQKQIRLTVLEQLVEIENTNYKLIEKSYSDMKKLKHDISNQVNVINDLIKHDDKKSAELVLKGIYESIDNAGAVCYTGEPIIDSIINIKIKEACTYGIKVTSRINIKYFNIDSVEICRILGNALDNAIEGCQRSESSEPNIHISIQQIENKIAVEISNSSCDVDLNNLHTNKFDKALHGIGIESMKTSVERLNGFMNQSCQNRIFFLKIVLPNK